MNDRQEMILLIDGFKEVVLEEYKANPFKVVSNEKVNGEVVCFSEEEVYNLIDMFYDIYYSEFKNKKSMKYTTFLSCFSESADILTQWCMYADDAKGISLGFNTKVIQKFVQKNENLKLIKIIYLNEDERKKIQKDIAKEIINEFKNSLPINLDKIIWYPKKIKESQGVSPTYAQEDIIKGLFGDLYQRCFIKLFKESIKYKNESFKQEEEWRLVYFPESMYWDCIPETEKEKKELKLIKYRISNGKLIKHIKVPLEKLIINPHMIFDGSNDSPRGSMDINKLIIGAKNVNSSDEIMFFLTKQGFSYLPRKSVIQYK